MYRANRHRGRPPSRGTAAGVAHDRFNHDFNNGLRRQAEFIGRLNEDMRKENTTKAYKKKQQEFNEYCNRVHGGRNRSPNEIYLVTNAKVYDFMCYVAFRSKRKAGKRKRGDESPDAFNYDEYREVKEKYFGPSNDSDDASIAELPTDGLGHDAINTYKSAIFNIFRDQDAQSTSLVWPQIWQSNCATLIEHVKARRKVIAKQNYEEKMDTSFTFFKAANKDSVLEEAMWEKGQSASNLRHAFPSIR